MALPFIAGALVGAGVVVALNNKKELKEVASKGYEKSKEVAGELKKQAGEAVESVKDRLKKEEPTESKKEVKPVKKTSTRKTTSKRTTKVKEDDK